MPPRGRPPSRRLRGEEPNGPAALSSSDHEGQAIDEDDDVEEREEGEDEQDEEEDDSNEEEVEDEEVDEVINNDSGDSDNESHVSNGDLDLNLGMNLI